MEMKKYNSLGKNVVIIIFAAAVIAFSVIGVKWWKTHMLSVEIKAIDSVIEQKKENVIEAKTKADISVRNYKEIVGDNTRKIEEAVVNEILEYDAYSDDDVIGDFYALVCRARSYNDEIRQRFSPDTD